MPPYRRKLIETAIPLDAINRESAKEKRNPFTKGHPRTLHLWWARRPLAACRAVIFCSLIDDPGEEGVPPELLAQIDALPAPNPLPTDWSALDAAEQRRRRLFRFIETLVKWESTTDEQVIGTARELILAATEGSPPPLLDPFCGGGSIPLEAQRLRPRSLRIRPQPSGRADHQGADRAAPKVRGPAPRQSRRARRA